MISNADTKAQLLMKEYLDKHELLIAQEQKEPPLESEINLLLS